MSLFFAAYSDSIFQELWLPEVDNADYDLLLDKETFHLSQDITIQLEILEGHWRYKGTQPPVKPGPDSIPAGKELESGDLIQIQDFNTGVGLVLMSASSSLDGYQKYRIISDCTLTIGAALDNNICYNFKQLASQHHAVLSINGRSCSIQDKNSKNGVFLNRRQIRGEVPLPFGQVVDIVGLRLIWLGDLLAIGSADGTFTIHTGALRPYTPEAPQDKTASEEALCTAEVFRRSPRVMPKIHTEPVEFEQPPQLQKLAKRPLLLTIGPSLTMVLPTIMGAAISVISARASGSNSGLYMYTGILIAVTSALLGTMWALLNLRYSKHQAKQAEANRQSRYAKYLIDTAKDVKEQYEHNNNALHQMYPAPEVCAQYGRLSPQLWARNFSHQDLLYHRLGIGSLPFQVPIVVPKRRFTMIDDDLADRPQKIHDDFQTLYQVPVGVDLMERRLWGILGNWKSRCAVARLLITQIAANNCYTDVKLAFLLDGRNRRNQEMWGFVRWLPHVWSEDGNIRYFAMNRSERGEVAYALNNVLRLRSEQKDNFQKQVYRPQYIVFVEREDLLEGESIAKYLLNSDTDLGVTTILLAEHPEDLPNSCVNLIQNDGQFQGFYYVEEGEESRRPLTFDHISLEDAEALSRRLASVKVSELERGGEIPDQLTFFEMMKCQSLEEMRVLDRWRKNRTYESMRALIGQKAGGLDCYLDIHEKYHGPHGLLAGTTGSGKSETLQTYILSLAVNFSPNDICFFIIDYKGGGMGNLFSGLPHVAGQISNLSGNQVYRAMVSIKSENRRRQRIFSEHGVNHIDQYTQLIKQNEATQPIPHLFIIIDEFAELKKEESDFMRELISVAQVGRSLGVHLILATQKPNGTVDENISSNAKFRLCLRVQNRQDSNEMLHKPDAAYITQAGRGYLQVGSDEIYEQFQSGWSGADYDEDATRNSGDLASMRTNTGRSAIVGNYAKKQQKEAQRRAWISALVRMVRTASQEEHSPESLLDALYALLEADSWNYTRSKSNDSRLLEFVQLCRKLDKPEQGAEDTAKLILETGDRLPECKSKTQLAAVVEYLGKVARENHYENSNPLWLPVLPDKLFWQSVVRAETVFQNGAWPGHTGPWDLRAVVGLSDDPANQQQEPLEISFSGGGHLALCGAVVSGKSTFLQTLVFDLIHRYSPQEVQFYMLDLSGSLLAPFAQAPHVGGILNEDEIGDVTKLFVMLEQLLAERKALLKGGSFSQYVREHSLPAVFLIIDNYANFREKTENRFENLLFTLSREGLSYGLFLVVSSGGFGISEVPSRMAGNFRNTVCLEMGDRFKYADVLHTIHIDVLPEANVKGRGLAPVGGNILEFQTALAMEAEDDYKRAEAIEAVCQQMANAWKGPKAAPIPSIPERPVWADLERWADMASIQSQPQLLPFAYYRRDASIASINLQNTYCWLISGGPRTGKTNLLRILLRSAKAKGGDTCVFELSGQRNLEMDCTRYQSEYVSDVQEVTEYFKKLTVIFQERNKKKHELEDQGASDEEIFAEMSKLPPVFLLIDSLEDFVHTLYNTPRDVSSCSALLETLTERGRLHNIYFFVCMDPLNSKVVGKKVYTNIVGYKTGIHLGGNVTTVLKHLNFRSVPFTEQEKPMKPGLGLLPPDALDPSVREVVIPKAVGEAKA